MTLKHKIDVYDFGAHGSLLELAEAIADEASHSGRSAQWCTAVLHDRAPNQLPHCGGFRPTLITDLDKVSFLEQEQ